MAGRSLDSGESPRPINGRRGWGILIGGIVAGVVGSGGGVWGYFATVGPQQIQSYARPDPFYGTQGRQIQQRLEAHLENHPDRALELRLIAIETELRFIRQQLSDMSK